MKTNFKTVEKKEYKETELGLLPKDWKVVKLGDVLVPDRIKLSKDEYKRNFPIVKKIPFDSGKIVFRDKKETRTDLYLSQENHLITSKINFHQGAVAITTQKTVATTHYEFYKILKKGDIYYLWRYFRTKEFKHLFSQEIKFRGFKKEANYKFIKDFKIPLPPLPEQKKIAFVLSTAQGVKEKTEQVINSLKKFKKSLMKHLFTYGPVSLRDAKRVKSKDTEIGKIPEGWEVIRLRDIFEFSRKPRNLRISEDENIVFIPMSYISESNSMISGWELKKYSKMSSGTFVFKNDLIVAKITPSFENGKQAILNNIPTDFAFATTEVWALYPKNIKQVTVNYLYNILKIPKFRKDLAAKMEGTTGRQRLPRHVLGNLLIPLPSPIIQKKIILILSAVDEKIEKEENKKKALEELFKAMPHNLMTAKIRVKDLEVKK